MSASAHRLPWVGLLLVLVALGLGRWQLQRATYKEARQQQLASAGVAQPVQGSADFPGRLGSRVRLRGHWQVERLQLVDNRVLDRRAGYHVLMPLRLGDGSEVVVNRGWVAAYADRSRLPGVATPHGEVELVGLARTPTEPGFWLGEPPGHVASPVRQRADLTALALPGVMQADWLLQQESEAVDGLLRRWPALDLGANRHRAYAFQWFALAALASLMCWPWLLALGRQLRLRVRGEATTDCGQD